MMAYNVASKAGSCTAAACSSAPFIRPILDTAAILVVSICVLFLRIIAVIA